MLTREQLAFARSMNERQWRTLHALVEWKFPLTAAERADRELYALIRHKLAAGYTAASGMQEWTATEAGRAAMKLSIAKRLYPSGPS